MIQIILLVLGIIAAIRYPRLARASAGSFPAVAPEAFAAWHRAEKAAAMWLIAATIGVFGLQLVVGFTLGVVLGASQAPQAQIENITGTLGVASLGPFLILLVGAGIMGSRARKLKGAAGIQWPQT